MYVYSKHFLDLFLRRSAWIFLLIQLFLGLWSLLAVLYRHPYLSPLRLAGWVADLLLILLPVTLPVALLIGGVMLVHEAHRHRGFLTIQLAGRDPRRCLWPLLMVGVAASLMLGWLTAAVIPKAVYQKQSMPTSMKENMETMALLMARRPDLLNEFEVSFGALDGRSLVDFCLVSRSPGHPMALSARHADCNLVEEDRFLAFQLHDGRLLGLDASGELSENFRFGRLELRFPMSRLDFGSKAEVRDLQYYTDSELDRLPEQVRILARHGELGPKMLSRVASIPFVRAVRIQSSLMPLLFLLLLVMIIGRHLGDRLNRRTIMLLLLCLGLLIPQQVFLEMKARKGGLDTLWTCYLPALEVSVLSMLWIVLRVIDSRRRHANP